MAFFPVSLGLPAYDQRDHDEKDLTHNDQTLTGNRCGEEVSHGSSYRQCSAVSAGRTKRVKDRSSAGLAGWLAIWCKPHLACSCYPPHCLLCANAAQRSGVARRIANPPHKSILHRRSTALLHLDLGRRRTALAGLHSAAILPSARSLAAAASSPIKTLARAIGFVR